VSSDALPPCGLYRTVKPIPLAGGTLEAGRLVYFHNHGNPGAGVYYPESWAHNRAHFAPTGATLPLDFDRDALRPLPPEGFYRVREPFHCCAKRCVSFQPEQLLQLGYNGAGRPLLFVPELREGVISTPERGTIVDDDRLDKLVALRVPEIPGLEASLPRGILMH
jgi:hypothetical protein